MRAETADYVAPEVAPGLNRIGVLLPTTPLHHLLIAELDFVVVATSGNRSEEPIVVDERDAVRQLAGLADCFLVHDRPIVRRVDDSVVQLVEGTQWCCEWPAATRRYRFRFWRNWPGVGRLSRRRSSPSAASRSRRRRCGPAPRRFYRRT